MYDIPFQLRPAAAFGEGLIYLAEHLVRAAARHAVRARPPRNTTLRPDPGTPMWNALVLAVRPHLRRRGEKINLESGVEGSAAAIRWN